MKSSPLENAALYFEKNPDEVKLKKSLSQKYSILNFANQFIVEVKERIGKGEYSVVKKAEHSKEIFTLKIVDSHESGLDKYIEILKKIGSFKAKLSRTYPKQKSIKAYNKIYTDSKTYILLEYIDGKNLKEIDLNTLSETQKHIIALLISIELKKLHDLRIIHADLKENNILVNIDPNNLYNIKVKIIDYNISTLLPVDSDYVTDTFSGSLPSMAPELKEKKPYTFSSDIYSLGLLFSKLSINSKLYSNCMYYNPEMRLTLDTIIGNLIDLFKDSADLENTYLNAILKTANEAIELQLLENAFKNMSTHEELSQPPLLMSNTALNLYKNTEQKANTVQNINAISGNIALAKLY